MMAIRPVGYQSPSRRHPYLARMLRTIILAATVGLVPVAAPAPPGAAVPSPVPAQVAPEQDCAQVKQRAQQAVLGTGGSATVTCQRRVSSPGPEMNAMEVAGCGFNSWTLGRHSACATRTGYLLEVWQFVENRVPVLVGAMEYEIITQNVTSGGSAQWTHSFAITMGFAWGAVGGTSVNANGECGAGNCSMLGFSFNFGLATPGIQRHGRAQFATSSPGFGAVWLTASTWRWWFTNPAWTPTISNSLTITPPAHRCDQAVGPPGSVGCVFAEKRPTHEIASTRYPKYARHIQLAINFGLPSVLTRTRDEAQMAANRATACPQSPTNGWSCDEYPFASTHEGAANPMHPYGRTFQILNWNSGYPPFYCGVNWVSTRRLGDSLGYSVCGIPLAENTGGGSDLAVFYFENRVLHNDQFVVRVV
jgi:hypothetical protein